MEIKLTKGFFIEPDEFQYILKQRYNAEDKEGNKKEAVKTISFHRTISQAIEKYLRMLQNVLTDDKAVTLREYVNLVTQENRKAIKAIKSFVEP